jgi:hypothetical protein
MIKKAKKSDDNKNSEDKYNQILVELSTIKSERTLLREDLVKAFSDIANSKHNQTLFKLDLLERLITTASDNKEELKSSHAKWLFYLCIVLFLIQVFILTKSLL